MKHLLKHLASDGRTGGIFDKRFRMSEKHNFVVTNTDRYILKVLKYPNLVILEKNGDSKLGYDTIKELDGLFDYRTGGKRHIVVLESKLDKINVSCDDLVERLFAPLRELFPDALFTYSLFSDRLSLFKHGSDIRVRELKPFMLEIWKTMYEDHGIPTLFLSFDEARSDFERMRVHLVTQYHWATGQMIEFNGRIALSERHIALFDQGQTPRIKLEKDQKTGLWRELPLRHR